jgi:hypothetical protein
MSSLFHDRRYTELLGGGGVVTYSAGGIGKGFNGDGLGNVTIPLIQLLLDANSASICGSGGLSQGSVERHVQRLGQFTAKLRSAKSRQSSGYWHTAILRNSNNGTRIPDLDSNGLVPLCSLTLPSSVMLRRMNWLRSLGTHLAVVTSAQFQQR